MGRETETMLEELQQQMTSCKKRLILKTKQENEQEREVVSEKSNSRRSRQSKAERDVAAALEASITSIEMSELEIIAGFQCVMTILQVRVVLSGTCWALVSDVVRVLLLSARFLLLSACFIPALCPLSAAFCCFLSLSSARFLLLSARFLLHSVAICCFLLLYAAFCCFLPASCPLLPIAHNAYPLPLSMSHRAQSHDHTLTHTTSRTFLTLNIFTLTHKLPLKLSTFQYSQHSTLNIPTPNPHSKQRRDKQTHTCA
jgi:hypothetical protein